MINIQSSIECCFSESSKMVSRSFDDYLHISSFPPRKSPFLVKLRVIFDNVFTNIAKCNPCCHLSNWTLSYTVIKV